MIQCINDDVYQLKENTLLNKKDFSNVELIFPIYNNLKSKKAMAIFTQKNLFCNHIFNFTSPASKTRSTVLKNQHGQGCNQFDS